MGYRTSRHEWPSDKGAGNEEERWLGAWLRTQRTNHRHGRLRPDREAQLDAKLPDWHLSLPPKGVGP
ncbi:helicase associated domain-containing protein [Arthrobacter sp. D5-1]|uniref:helicase associated domain-containing protein n=1 Tax=Arthrobacter sp. D5-1 TaxID=1477518 RepID=UPI001F60F557|nr:helicase associated domain-containing protein [Arthrobacter sp. D5-1]